LNIFYFLFLLFFFRFRFFFFFFFGGLGNGVVRLGGMARGSTNALVSDGAGGTATGEPGGGGGGSVGAGGSSPAAAFLRSCICLWRAMRRS
jgi:hypothetical protein